jgi:hypothetical protein
LCWAGYGLALPWAVCHGVGRPWAGLYRAGLALGWAGIVRAGCELFWPVFGCTGRGLGWPWAVLAVDLSGCGMDDAWDIPAVGWPWSDLAIAWDGHGLGWAENGLGYP